MITDLEGVEAQEDESYGAEFFFPGRAVRVADLKGGECIIFQVSGEMHVGMAIPIAEGTEIGVALLDFDAETPAPNAHFTRFEVYRSHSFNNEDIFVIDTARISPVLDTTSMNLGLFEDRTLSRALYIGQSGPTVSVARDRYHYQVNLADGSITNEDLSRSIHFGRWKIEYGDADGEPVLLREIVAKTVHPPT
ncbi:hypothetical protein MBUL_04476 (plasmid) [Methylobacterium bullatum]|uniref:Uncharacterized protein n=1 Tax=Methylobacterium bullatum TaxID=570505 RepID=A0A679JRW1_9HYPH|nr:hypothetical protein MBUL_04476 [Methylobacterium bullatum]